MTGTSVRLGTIAALAIGLGLAAQSAAAREPIAVLGGAKPAEIRLSPAGADRREGRTTVLVRNRTRRRLTLRIRYVLDEPSPTITADAEVHSSGPRKEGPVDRPRGLAAPLVAMDTAVVLLRLAASARNAEDASGRLVLTAENVHSSARRSAPIVVRVSTVRREERDVTVVPSEVVVPSERYNTVSLDEGFPFLHVHSVSKPARLALHGPGTAAVGTMWRDVVLRRDDGEAVVARVDDLGWSEAARELSIMPAAVADPGTYRGELLLGPGPNAPRAVVTLNARLSFWAAVLIVFLGAIAGQFVPLLTERSRSRKWLRQRTHSAVQRYVWLRRGRPATVAYDLDDEIGHWAWSPRERGNDPPDGDRAQLLLRDITMARTESEMAEAKTSVDCFESDVRTWCRVERAASALEAALQRGKALPPHGEGRSFARMAAYTEAAEILDRAQERPGKVDPFVECVQREARLLRIAIAIWEIEGASDPPEDSRVRIGWGDPKPWLVRKGGEWSALRSRLDAQLKEAADERRRSVPSYDEVAVAEGNSSAPRIRWRDRASLRARGQGLPVLIVETLSTLLSVAVPCAVYMVAAYDATWGAAADVVTAFAAGFLGKIAIDWAGLALLRSARGWLGASGSQASPAT